LFRNLTHILFIPGEKRETGEKGGKLGTFKSPKTLIFNYLL